MEDLDAKIAAARKRRRLGYAIFGFITLYMSVPMIVGAFAGVANGQIWDPYTGEPYVATADNKQTCIEESSRLIQQAGTLDKISRQWEEPAKHWFAKCGKEHADLKQVLETTRAELRARGKK